MFKGALIGFGQVAEKAHAPAFKHMQALQIVAVVEANAGRRTAAKRHFPGISAYTTLDEMFRQEKRLSFVDIATPPHLHAPQIAQCLQHSCHVLCEKPLTLTLKDFENIRRFAKKYNRTVFPVHNWKYAPLFQKLKTIIQVGLLGDIRHIEWHTLRNQPAQVAVKAPSNWRTNRKLSGGGILMDHGWHAFYLISWLLGKNPQSVTGILKFPQRSDTEDEATCLIEFQNASALVYLTWNAPRRGHWGILHGTAGSVELKDDRLRLTQHSQPPQDFVFPQKLSFGSAHPDWFGALLLEFKDIVKIPSQRGAFLDEAHGCIWMLEQLYNSPRKKYLPVFRQTAR